MNTGEAVVPYGIPMAGWKSIGEEWVDMLLYMLPNILEQENMPEEWASSAIEPICKENSDTQYCENYRGV